MLAATNSEPPFPAAPQVSSHSCTGSADGGSTVSSGGSAVSYLLNRAGTVPSTRSPTATSTPPAEGAAPAAPVRPTPQLAQTVRLCAGTPNRDLWRAAAPVLFHHDALTPLNRLHSQSLAGPCSLLLAVAGRGQRPPETQAWAFVRGGARCPPNERSRAAHRTTAVIGNLFIPSSSFPQPQLDSSAVVR